MSQRRVQIIILCEDRQQEVFARYFLEKRGFKGRFRIRVCPKGQKSGEQYVRTQYPLEVRAYRQNRNRVSVGLVVLIDADTEMPGNRFKQLNFLLREQFQSVRQENEAIAIFTPKRNIETWIHYLQGEPVNEEETYAKFHNNEATCKPYVENLVLQCHSGNLPETAPQSLQIACPELQRLLPLIQNKV
jgi:hypothetical protein